MINFKDVNINNKMLSLIVTSERITIRPTNINLLIGGN